MGPVTTWVPVLHTHGANAPCTRCFYTSMIFMGIHLDLLPSFMNPPPAPMPTPPPQPSAASQSWAPPPFCLGASVIGPGAFPKWPPSLARAHSQSPPILSPVFAPSPTGSAASPNLPNSQLARLHPSRLARLHPSQLARLHPPNWLGRTSSISCVFMRV
jgi:hypothetical protein